MIQEIKNKKRNSYARRIERNDFICKHPVRIKELIEVYKNQDLGWRKKIKEFVEKEVRPEIEYYFSSGWLNIFIVIKRGYENLFPKYVPEKILKLEDKEEEYNWRVHEDRMEIEDEYCSHFGCGKKLIRVEKLCGNKCLKHQGETETLFHNGRL